MNCELISTNLSRKNEMFRPHVIWPITTSCLQSTNWIQIAIAPRYVLGNPTRYRGDEGDKVG